MKTDALELTQPQLDQYKRDGYFAVPHLFIAREVAAMVAELERFKRAGLGRDRKSVV